MVPVEIPSNNSVISTHLMARLAKTLGVSADQLLGTEPMRAPARSRDSRLWRRFKQLEKLPPA